MFFKSRRKPKPQTPTHLVVEPLYMNETFIHWRERRQHLIPLHLIRMMDYFDLLLADERFHVVRIILKDGTAYCTIQQILFTKI